MNVPRVPATMAELAMIMSMTTTAVVQRDIPESSVQQVG